MIIEISLFRILILLNSSFIYRLKKYIVKTQLLFHPGVSWPDSFAN